MRQLHTSVWSGLLHIISGIWRYEDAKDIRWAFKWSTVVLSGATSATSFLVHRHFRKAFNLLHFHNLPVAVVVIGMPSLVSIFLQQSFIDDKIYSLSFSCPECVKLRSGLINGTISVVYPVLLAGPLAMMYSRKKKTYLYPGQNFVPNMQMFFRTTVSMKYLLAAGFFLNVFTGHYATHFKMENLLKVLQILRASTVEE